VRSSGCAGSATAAAFSTLRDVSPETKRRWRDYRTAAGRRPIKEFIDALSDVDAAAVVAAMKDVREAGLAAARHLRGEIYEVRADGDRQTFRVLFAPEGQRVQVLLALEAFRRRRRRRRRRFSTPRGGWQTGGAAARSNLSDEIPTAL
jgi:Phage derived protein Gp49-like (DUF891)